MKILLQSIFREAASKRELAKEARPGLTLKDLLNELANEYGGEFKDIIDAKTGEISPDVLIMINGISVRKVDLQLKDDDIVMIGTPIGGG